MHKIMAFTICEAKMKTKIKTNYIKPKTKIKYLKVNYLLRLQFPERYTVEITSPI